MCEEWEYIQYLTKVSTPLTFQQKKIVEFLKGQYCTNKTWIYFFKSSHCAACIEVYIYSKYNSKYNHYCPKNWQQKLVNMSKLCPKCQYFVGAPLLSITALIFLGIEFTRATHVFVGILFHSSTMTQRSCWMLDTWCFSTFHLRMPQMCSIWFRSGDTLGHSITFTFSSRAVIILAVCLGWLCWKTVSEGGHHLLLQNVTVHVGIHVSLSEPQLPDTSSSHAAPDHDATTTMLDCRQDTILLALLTRASPHMLDTIWVKQVYLRLIRPQDMVPVIHALG